MMETNDPRKGAKFKQIKRYLMPQVGIPEAKEPLENGSTKESETTRSLPKELVKRRNKPEGEKNNARKLIFALNNRKRQHPEDEYLSFLLSQLSRKEMKLEERNPLAVPRSESPEEQAHYVEVLRTIVESTYWTAQDRLWYTISSEWLGQWSGYISCLNTPSNNSNSSPPEKTLTSSSPGPINNQSLVVDAREYSRNYYPQGREGLVLKDTVDEGKDYQIVTQDMWEYLHSLYGGDELPIHSVPLGVNARSKKDIKMLKVSIKLSG